MTNIISINFLEQIKLFCLVGTTTVFSFILKLKFHSGLDLEPNPVFLAIISVHLTYKYLKQISEIGYFSLSEIYADLLFQMFDIEFTLPFTYGNKG